MVGLVYMGSSTLGLRDRKPSAAGLKPRRRLVLYVAISRPRLGSGKARFHLSRLGQCDWLSLAEGAAEF